MATTIQQSAERPVCDEPARTLTVEASAHQEVLACPVTFCLWPVVMTVRNPNEVPLFVVEVHLLDAARVTARMVDYEPPVPVPPGTTIELPRRHEVGPDAAYYLRTLYLDGRGNEFVDEVRVVREQPVSGEAQPPPVEPSCVFIPAPELMPLTIEAHPNCAGVVDGSINIDNPNSHRLRIVDVWIDHPGGGTTQPARLDSALHYIEPESSAPLPYRMSFAGVGSHTVRLNYRDGWGRRHEFRTMIDVPSCESVR